MKTRCPWMSFVLVLVLAVIPPGRDIIDTAFFSGEQLARSLTQLVLMGIVGVLFAIGIIEWGIRTYFARRRATALQTAAGQMPHEGELSG